MKKNKEHGLLIIELMIGLLMASITILGAFSVYAKFEGEKRTIVQMGQTVSGGGISVSIMETHARIAGYGIPNRDFSSCNVNGFNANLGTGGEEFSFSLQPVLITQGTNPQDSDSVTFLYGSNNLVLSPLALTTQVNYNDVNVPVDNKWGVKAGDLFVIAESGKPCTLSQVSAVDNSSSTLIRNTGTYQIGSMTYPLNYNKAGGLSVKTNYSMGATVFVLGNNPSFIRYSVSNRQLNEENLFTLENNVVADNVLIMKARYGLDTNSDGVIESWAPIITNAADYKFLKALKIGIITQSPLKERPINGVCNITTNPSFPFGNESIDITDIVPDWGCYRYRFIQSEFVLRNVVWVNSL